MKTLEKGKLLHEVMKLHLENSGAAPTTMTFNSLTNSAHTFNVRKEQKRRRA